MEQKSLYDMHKATKANILSWVPFELIADGEVIAIVYDMHILPKPKLEAKYDMHENNDDMHIAKQDMHKNGSDNAKKGQVDSQSVPLYQRFSKQSQAAGKMRSG
jgi:hypothetical protein